MAIALDATAHPAGGGNLSATKSEGLSGIWQTIVSPSFSTGPGPILVLCKLWCSGGAAPMPFNSVANTSGLAWTKWKSEVSAGGNGNAEIWRAFSVGGSLGSQTVTATARTSSATQQGLMDVEVWSGVPNTEAACLGNTSGFQDDVGVSQTINTTITATAAGSVLSGIFGQDDALTTLTADANTTPWDVTWSGTLVGFDYAGSGYYKANGGVTPSSGSFTFGSSTAETFGAVAAVEILAPSSSPAFEEDAWVTPRPIDCEMTVTVYA